MTGRPPHVRSAAAHPVQPEEIVVTVCRPDSPKVEQGILLRELNHRINNGLASAINLVSAAAVRAEGSEAKRALSDMVELLHGYADVQQALATPRGKALIDAATYVRMMGSAMRRSLLDRMNIRLALATESLPLQPERCRRLGLIVHGLVTDAAKHACFEARTGEITVKLTRVGTVVNCVVLDNGSRPAPRDADSGSLTILPRVLAVGSSAASAPISHQSSCRFR
jgi:two-component sensor histidine kinase